MELFLMGVGIMSGVFLVLWFFQVQKSNRLLEDISFQISQLDVSVDWIKIRMTKEINKDLSLPPKAVIERHPPKKDPVENPKSSFWDLPNARVEHGKKIKAARERNKVKVKIE